MIIDARQSKSCAAKWRPFTVVSAVYNAVYGINVGENIRVDALVDAAGEDLPLQMLHTNLNKVKASRTFSVRSGAKDGFLATIYRVA